jgi:hypothetical protein
VLRFIINCFLVLWLGLLTAATIESHRGADWSRVKGIAAPQGKQAPPDLLERMEQAAWRRNATVKLGEAEVNRYLARVISGRQHGPVGTAAQFERVALDFEPGLCRVIFSWNVAGRGATSATVDFTVKRDGENFVIEPRHGSYGRLPVFRGMMCALMPALESLCGALDSEINAVFQMNQIQFGQDEVILDPRSEAGKS